MITVEGSLIRDAELRATVDGQYVVSLVVQPGRGHPFSVGRTFPASDVTRARIMAAACKRGRSATVAAIGCFRFVSDHDLARFSLLDDGALISIDGVSF